MAEQSIKLEACGRAVEFTMDLDPNDPQDAYLLQHFISGQCYEPELAWLLFRVLREGDVAVDVGANVGFFTLLMSKLVGPSGKVIAFEPGPNNVLALKANLGRNGIDNVEVIERPVWCKHDLVTFYLNADSSGGHALFDPANWPSNVKSQANPQPVPMLATTLDELAERQENIKLIKIDTEGAEQKILEGAQNLILNQWPLYVISEINPHGLAQSGCDENSLRRRMFNNGYEAFALHGNGAIPSLIPAKTRICPEGYNGISNVLFSTMSGIAAAWPTVN